MIDTLGQPALPWMVTGRGRLHDPVVWEPNLPAKLEWKGEVIGEIQRGPGQQQVVLPPSEHPDTGLRYRWITPAGVKRPADLVAGISRRTARQPERIGRQYSSEVHTDIRHSSLRLNDE